ERDTRILTNGLVTNSQKYREAGSIGGHYPEPQFAGRARSPAKPPETTTAYPKCGVPGHGKRHSRAGPAGPREARPARGADGDGAAEGLRPRARRQALTIRVTSPARRGGGREDRGRVVPLGSESYNWRGLSRLRRLSR